MSYIKLYKIPYSDKCYFGRDYNIYSLQNDTVTKIAEIGCQLYKLPYMFLRYYAEENDVLNLKYLMKAQRLSKGYLKMKVLRE